MVIATRSIKLDAAPPGGAVPPGFMPEPEPGGTPSAKNPLSHKPKEAAAPTQNSQRNPQHNSLRKPIQ